MRNYRIFRHAGYLAQQFQQIASDDLAMTDCQWACGVGFSASPLPPDIHRDRLSPKERGAAQQLSESLIKRMMGLRGNCLNRDLCDFNDSGDYLKSYNQQNHTNHSSDN